MLILELVLQVTGDFIVFGKCAQTSKELNTLVKELEPTLYTVSHETNKCIVCMKRKANFDDRWKIHVHKKCLRGELQNEYYLSNDFYWKRIAPFEGYLTNRFPFAYDAFWENDNGMIPRCKTVEFILKAHTAGINARLKLAEDRAQAENAIKIAQDAALVRFKNMTIPEKREYALQERKNKWNPTIWSELARLADENEILIRNELGDFYSKIVHPKTKEEVIYDIYRRLKQKIILKEYRERQKNSN